MRHSVMLFAPLGLLLLVFPHFVLAHTFQIETNRANMLLVYYCGCMAGAGLLNIWTRVRESARGYEDHSWGARWRSFVSGKPPRRTS